MLSRTDLVCYSMARHGVPTFGVPSIAHISGVVLKKYSKTWLKSVDRKAFLFEYPKWRDLELTLEQCTYAMLLIVYTPPQQ